MLALSLFTFSQCNYRVSPLLPLLRLLIKYDFQFQFQLSRRATHVFALLFM